MKKQFCLIFLLLTFCVGCGHMKSHKVGLMSLGDLEGKTIPKNIDGKILEGEDCGGSYYLSQAVRNAVKETTYDTLIDVEVTNTTGLFVPSNCIKVKGKAIDSKSLTNPGA